MKANPEQVEMFAASEGEASEAGDASKVRKVGKMRKQRRAGAARPGPKPRAERKGFCKHVQRPEHNWRHPVHVTIRRVRLGPNFRAQIVYNAIVRQISVAKSRGVRVNEYSVQKDHLHLMVEGNDRENLARQMCRLFSRIALAVNRLVERSGPLFRDRHHRHALSTPTEVRNALVYILFNFRKHAAAYLGATARTALDGFSSAPWFAQWDPNAGPPPDAIARMRAFSPPEVTTPARTWLARIGWQRGGLRGLLRFDEQPRAALVATS